MLAVLLATIESTQDQQKFIEIFEHNHEQMERTALRILKTQQDAEDAVQNAFVKVIRHFDKIYDLPSDRLPYWLIAIVKNEAFSILRKQQKILPLEDWSQCSNDITDISEYSDLVKLFSKLPDSYRAVLEMKFLLGYADGEIATLLGISKTAVSTRASRGKTLLRNIVEKEGYFI